MEQILSQNEVNALLTAVEGGQVSQEDGDMGIDDDDVVSFDITSQDRIIRGRMNTLEILNDRFARQYRMTLTNSLRKLVEVSIESTTILKFSEYLSFLPVPSCINMIKLHPLKGTCLLSIEVKLLYGLLDTFFGGSSVYTPNNRIEGRDFTAIELGLIKKVIDLYLSDMASIWRPIFEISPEYYRTEINPQFVLIAPPSDVVICSTFEIELEHLRGTLSFVIPYSAVEPIKQKLSSGVQSDSMDEDSSWRDRILDQVKTSDVGIEVLLGKTQITLRELLNVRQGDILQLDNYAEDHMSLKMQGVPKAKVKPKINRNNLACTIMNHINTEPFSEYKVS